MPRNRMPSFDRSWTDPQVMQRRSLRLMQTVLTYVVLGNLAFVFLFPIIYMLLTSFKTRQDLNDVTIIWLPRTLHWDNYAIAFELLDYFEVLKNSLVLIVPTTIGQVLTCSLVGYGFARVRFLGAKCCFSSSCSRSSFHHRRSSCRISLCIGSLIGSIPTIHWSCRRFLESVRMLAVHTGIPTVLPDATLGARGRWDDRRRRLVARLLADHVAIGQAGPYWLFCSFALVWQWNDVFTPGLVFRSEEFWTLPMQLFRVKSLSQIDPMALASREGATVYNEAIGMAATFLEVLPLLIMYLFVQTLLRGEHRSDRPGRVSSAPARFCRQRSVPGLSSLQVRVAVSSVEAGLLRGGSTKLILVGAKV